MQPATNVDIASAFLLGILQAITEFLPISSSGHLVIAQDVLDSSLDSLLFDVSLHVGTGLAVAVYFRKRIATLIVASAKYLVGSSTEPTGHQQATIILIATVPAAVAGFFLHEIIETYTREPWLIVLTLTVGGIFLWKSDSNQEITSGINRLRIRDAISIGLAQAIALVPGFSRSAMTIGAARLLGISRRDSAELSFLLALPIIFGAGLFTIIGADLTEHNGTLANFAVGILTSFACGLLVIKYLIRYLENHSLQMFVWYRFTLAAVITVVLLLP
tara:strand:+ start:444 stop:1268 length:825 start_codon:yes stop_codon:yes gene_type:complete